ncbi:extracellular solute-binding protein [Chloroflexota bacterium]
MRKPLSFTLWFLLLALLAGCSNLPVIGQTASDTATPTMPPTAEPDLPVATEEGNLPITLQIWIPDEFAPNEENDPGSVLQQRLTAFSERHPGVRVDVRIKAAQGSANLYESLTAASAAAPLALPDLILLPKDDMLEAASNDLIFPIDDFLLEPRAEDWYSFAVEMGQYQGKTYSLPFAVDALIMAYRPALLEVVPSDWQLVAETPGSLIFPAADPLSLFTIAEYLSEGVQIYDDNQALYLDLDALTAVLNFYSQGQATNSIPFWLTQYDSQQAAWDAFLSGRGHMSIIWSNQYFQQDNNGNLLASPIPTSSGTPFTLTTSWVWALTGSNPDRHQIAVELALFLTEPEFLGQFTFSAGYLPPRADSLAVWPESNQLALASQILPSAQVLPPKNDLIILGEPLSIAVIEVLKQENSPEEAAQNAIDSLP